MPGRRSGAAGQVLAEMGGIDDCPLAHQQAALLQHRPDFLEQHPGQVVALQPMAELQQRRGIGHRIAVQLDATKPRSAWLSYNASSTASSASPYHCCTK